MRKRSIVHPVFAYCFLCIFLSYILFHLHAEKKHVYPVGQNAEQDRSPSNDGQVQPHIDHLHVAFLLLSSGTLGL